MNRKSIFVYIYGYIPGSSYGGPVTSIANFSDWFGDEYDVRIVCSNHDFGAKIKYKDIHEGWNEVGKAKVFYLDESQYSESRFLQLMSGFDISFTYLTGVLSFKLNNAAIKASRKLGVPVVVATRGELCENALRMKAWKKIPYLRILRLTRYFNGIHFQVTSDEELFQLKRYLGIPDYAISMLPNVHGRKSISEPLQKVSGFARVLFVSRIHPKKNLLEAIKAATLVKGDLAFDIYGPIEDEAYWAECQAVIDRAPNNVKIAYKGALDTSAAKSIYSRYHAFLFPTMTENYGHVIVESMISDCPVIISRGTTPWDDLDNRAGYVVPLHDLSGFAAALEKVICMDETAFIAFRKNLCNYREEKLKTEDLLDGYRKMIHDAKNTKNCEFGA